MPSSPSLVIGCGYLGQRVTTAWLAMGRRVIALTRGRAAALSAMGLEPIVGDVLAPDSLRQFPEVGAVLYAVGLDRSAGRTMREVYVEGLAYTQVTNAGIKKPKSQISGLQVPR
jgi:nucleoside-diphosphate-sugar epimerase